MSEIIANGVGASRLSGEHLAVLTVINIGGQDRNIFRPDED